MKVPIIDSILGLADEGLTWINKADQRRRQRCIKSADKLVENLEGLELPDKAQHYLEQYKIRRERLV